MKYFKPEEFVMAGENVFNEMDTEFLMLLDALREAVGEPLKLNSTFRSERYNQKVGGSKHSYHLKGMAADIHCDNGIFRRQIINHALALGLSVGISKNFIHVDNRTTPIVFTY